MQPLIDKQQQQQQKQHQQVLGENGCQVVYNLQTSYNWHG
jgi:hypothetical protein